MGEISDGDRDVLRSAWAAYCDEVKAKGLRVVDELDDVDNPQELAEALRSVARMSMLCLQQRMDFDDPDFPMFFRALDDRYKYGGPDTYITYINAAVRGTGTYRITGQHHGRDLQLGKFWAKDLTYQPDGSFEIIASAEEHEGNWHPLDPALGNEPHVVPDMYPMASGGFGGRTYYHDPADDRPASEFFIERIDPDRPRQPEPLSPGRLAGQIGDATALFEKMAVWWLQRSSNIRAENEPNVVGPAGSQPPGVPGYVPAGTNFPLNYGICCWELGPDEALVVETDLPDTAYWSFQLHNPWWESPDNQHRQTSVSYAHAHLDADGRFRCVLSHRDPGVPNWLDTGGSRRGFLFYRWVRPVGEMPTPVATLTTVDRVRDHLPADHPVTDQATRDAQLAQRRRWFAGRFQR